MTEKVMTVRRVDHVYIASPDPDPLFALLTDVLRLPVAWPMDEFTGARSGGVLAGETAIEVIIFAAQARLPREERRAAQLRGVAFEPALPQTQLMAELRARKVSFTEPESVSEKGFAWTAIGLPDFLPGQAFVFFCRYHNDEGLRRRQIIQRARTRGDDSLGVVGIEEVVIGASDVTAEQTRWQRLLDPVLPLEGRWELGIGPALHVVPSETDRILALVLRVQSLSNAERALRGYGLLGTASQTQVSVSAKELQGVDIRLIGD
jgi:hypothetical protein